MSSRIMQGTIIFVLASAAWGQPTPASIEATTTTGEKVVLHPNGRWEYRDAKKAAEAKSIADQFPENRVKPADTQGGWFGTRLIMPGDPAYNRGTLSPKGR